MSTLIAAARDAQSVLQNPDATIAERLAAAHALETARRATGDAYGVCRICGCTDLQACTIGEEGDTCYWIDDDHTLCSACVPEIDPGELLPCPFCGGIAHQEEIPDDGTEPDSFDGAVSDAGGSYIECEDCGACTALHFDRKENLVSSWNRRATAPAPQAATVNDSLTVGAVKESLTTAATDVLAEREGWGMEYYIVDIRPEWRGKPYITLWRPNDAGYAFPLPWAGKYDRARVDAAPNYYAKKEGARFVRFPVPCEAVEQLGVAPAPRVIDGDAGPVIPNTAKARAALRSARYLPRAAAQGGGR